MKFKSQPYTHQREAFERFKDKEFYALFWEMGTGKTKVSIDIAAHKFLYGDVNRFVVVAPNTVQAQWVKEQLPEHCPYPFKGHVFESKTTDRYQSELFRFLLSGEDNPETMHFLAIHFEAFQHSKIRVALEKFLGGKKPFWIVDEATNIKNPNAVTTKSLMALRNMYKGHATVLTGTSIAKTPVDVWSMIEFLKVGYMACSYTAFRRRHAIITKHEVEVNRGGRLYRAKVDITLSPAKFWKVKAELKKQKQIGDTLCDDGIYATIAYQNDLTMADVKLIDEADKPIKYKNLEQLKIFLSDVSSSLQKADCLDLPEKQYQEVILPLSKEQKQLINSLKAHSVAKYGNMQLTMTQKVTLQIRALQICGGFFPHERENVTGTYDTQRLAGPNAKLDYLINDIPELGGAPFIVWAVFVAELEMLRYELSKKTTVGLLSGSTPKEEREELRKAFVDGEIQCLVANPQVAGYGLNFQHALVQYFYSRSYRTEARLQAEDRSHRIGIAGSPLYKDLVYDCEFEKAVMESNKQGKDMNDYFNSRSVEQLFSI